MKPANLESALVAADEAGVKLEMVGGVPTWEAFPSRRHIQAVRKIVKGISSTEESRSKGCECVHYEDLYVRFPDGSFKRPDISIFCREPDELDTAVTLIPEAIVEVLSKGYEAKDLQIGVPFYLAQGIADVIVVDPFDGQVRWFTNSGMTQIVHGSTIRLACGCSIRFDD